MVFQIAAVGGVLAIENEYHMISRMVDISQVIEKVQNYIDILSQMLDALDADKKEPPYKDLPTSFSLDQFIEFRTALSYLQSWQLSFIRKILTSLKQELEDLLQEINDSTSVLSNANVAVESLNEHVRVVSKGISTDHAFRSNSDSIIGSLIQGFFDTIKGVKDRGIVDVTKDVISDLFNLQTAYSLELPTEDDLTKVELKGFAYSQLLAICEVWEHSVRVLKDRVRQLLAGVMDSSGYLNKHVMPPSKLKKEMDEATENDLKDNEEFSVNLATAYNPGVVPVSKAFAIDPNTKKKYLMWNVFLKKALKGVSSGNPAALSDFILDFVDEFWFQQFVIELAQV